MIIRRGEIRWAELDPVRGPEQAGRRPVLVLSLDSSYAFLHPVGRLGERGGVLAPHAGARDRMPAKQEQVRAPSPLATFSFRTGSVKRLCVPSAKLVQPLVQETPFLGGSDVYVCDRRARLKPALRLALER